jgi:hypothetical protein
LLLLLQQQETLQQVTVSAVTAEALQPSRMLVLHLVVAAVLVLLQPHVLVVLD